MPRRRVGTALVALGLVLAAYAAITLVWRDPLTDLYARWKQGALSSELESAFAEYRAGAALARENDDTVRQAVAQAAREYRRSLELGEAAGRIEIPKLGIDPVFVQGTRWGPDLSRGPGHYEQTSLPGLGRTTGIAGHRTTFGAPFRRIDDLERGDTIVLRLPYGTFHYTVVGHEIVDANDWSVIRPRGYDAVMLSACHPLYSAERRWIVYGRLTEVEPVGGAAYALAGRGPADTSG
jgi:sortase A